MIARKGEDSMTYTVTENCKDCMFTDCVAVCPVDCFHEGVNFLAIDPDVCIDCGLCPPECPTSAIFAEEDLPEKWKSFVEINKKYSPLWPVIDSQKEALPGADEQAKIENKAAQLDPAPFGG